MKTAYDILLKPVITEQAMEQGDLKKYVFIVARDANKIEIRKAVEEAFGVKVAKVTTTHVRGKQRRTPPGPPRPGRRLWSALRRTPRPSSSLK